MLWRTARGALTGEESLLDRPITGYPSDDLIVTVYTPDIVTGYG
jgi:hypothetical protein